MAEENEIIEDDDAKEFMNWWDSLTPEEKHARAMRHQGGDDPVHVYTQEELSADPDARETGGGADVSIDDSENFAKTESGIKPKYKTYEEWLRATEGAIG